MFSVLSALLPITFKDIIVDITPDSVSGEVHAIVDRAFSRSYIEVEQSLLALAPSILMSKRYCSANSCAVIALVIHKFVCVGNVGVCAGMLRICTRTIW